MAGEVICSPAIRSRSGSDVFAAQCKATQEPDGSWRIDGTKMFTSGANLASYVLMLAAPTPMCPSTRADTCSRAAEGRRRRDTAGPTPSRTSARISPSMTVYAFPTAIAWARSTAA
jgi:alkylation response protein AidB-like acyl-CoA dehydrogenase